MPILLCVLVDIFFSQACLGMPSNISLCHLISHPLVKSCLSRHFRSFVHTRISKDSFLFFILIAYNEVILLAYSLVVPPLVYVTYI
jgi:hypothetical protein